LQKDNAKFIGRSTRKVNRDCGKMKINPAGNIEFAGNP